MSLAPPSLSPSSFSSFKECPLAFQFSYLDRLPEPPAPWTTKGTLVHRALELLLDRPADERSIDAALADLGARPDRARAPPRFRRPRAPDEEWAKFDADAESLVRKYFELEDPTTIRPDRPRAQARGRLGALACAASSTGSSSTSTASSSSPTTRPARCRRSSSRPRASPACTSTRSCASGCSGGARRGCSSTTSRSPKRSSPLPPTSRSAASSGARPRSCDAIAQACSRDDFRPDPAACATSARSSPTARRTAATPPTPRSSAGRARSSHPSLPLATASELTSRPRRPVTSPGGMQQAWPEAGRAAAERPGRVSRVHALDLRIDKFVDRIRGPQLDPVFYGLSSAADHGLLWLARGGRPSGPRGEPGIALRLGAVLGVESVLTNGAIKACFRRVRPADDHPPDGPLPYGMHRPITRSFPSGHATSAFTAATAPRRRTATPGAGSRSPRSWRPAACTRGCTTPPTSSPAPRSASCSARSPVACSRWTDGRAALRARVWSLPAQRHRCAWCQEPPWPVPSPSPSTTAARSPTTATRR